MSRVLLVEDNPQNRYLVTYLLTANGYEVTEATTGPDGVAMARSNAWDAILLDIQLPGMDGFDVLSTLREDPNLSAVPIVAITSHAMAGDRERILNAGCTGYIEKPINPETFVASITALLRGPTPHQPEKPV